MTTTLTSPARQANTRTIEATDRIGYARRSRTASRSPTVVC